MTSFVNDSGEYLDYSGDDFGLTKQVATWHDFKIKGDVSVDLKIPNTSQNRDRLNYYGAQQISPTISSDWTVVRNGNKIMRGSLVIKGIDALNIECFFISGNANWFNALQFNLKEIDFADSYTIVADGIYSSFANTEGIIFPLVDWWAQGQHRSTAFKYNYTDRQEGFSPFNEFHPCLYLRTLVEQMCQHGGIKISGDLVTDALYKRIIITPDGPDIFWPDSFVEQSRVKAFVSTATVNYSTASDPQPVQWVKPTELGASLFNSSDYSFNIARTATYIIKLEFFFSPAASYKAELWVKASGASSFSYSADIFTAGDYEYIEIYRTFNKGDQFQIRISRTVGGPTYRVTDPPGYTNITVEIAKNIGTITLPDYIEWTPQVTYEIPPMAICPDMKAVDLVKFLCIYFGAVCSYDECSKTLSINKLSRKKREDALDWSEYFISQKTVLQNVALHNYIKFSDGPEEFIKSYNKQSKTTYGGGDIMTDNDREFERTIYTIPFSPSYDDVNGTQSDWFMPYINFYDLELEETVAYSGVASYAHVSGAALINLTITAFDGDVDVTKVFFVKSTSGEYTGFHSLTFLNTTTSLILNSVYGSNDTGTVTMYKVSKTSGKHRLLLSYPETLVSNAGGSNFWIMTPAGGGDNRTVMDLAFFDKPTTGAEIDKIKDSLAIDPVSLRTYNNNIGERYHAELENIYNNPKIDAFFLLPTSVFQSFDFGNFVYLKTKDLTGYFWVQKIDQYKDADTPVKVELLYVD